MIWGIFIHAMFISITIFIMNANTCSDIIGMEIFYFKVIRRLRIIVYLFQKRGVISDFLSEYQFSCS